MQEQIRELYQKLYNQNIEIFEGIKSAVKKKRIVSMHQLPYQQF